jgi:hypothetical protein
VTAVRHQSAGSGEEGVLTSVHATAANDFRLGVRRGS